MTEDELLKELGDLARREQEAELAFLDERWDRLAGGTLSAEEDAELRALAASSPAIREVYEAFRPLGADFQARMVAAATAELARGPAPGPEEDASRSEQKSGARVLTFRGVSRSLAWLGSVAAAAVLIYFLRPVAPLPAYKAQMEGGDRSERGEPAQVNGLPVLVSGSLLTLTAQPAQTVEGQVKARVFFLPLAGDGDLRLLNAEPKIAESGAARLQGRVGQEIQIPPGKWRVWIVVGRPRAIPAADELAAALRTGQAAGDGWQAVSADLRVDDRAPP